MTFVPIEYMFELFFIYQLDFHQIYAFPNLEVQW